MLSVKFSFDLIVIYSRKTYLVPTIHIGKYWVSFYKIFLNPSFKISTSFALLYCFHY